jgi:hypothetical protein
MAQLGAGTYWRLDWCLWFLVVEEEINIEKVAGVIGQDMLIADD